MAFSLLLVQSKSSIYLGKSISKLNIYIHYIEINVKISL